MRILLVEDEAEMAGLVARRLTASGFLVDVVGRLDEAAAALSLARYQLALLDRRLPDGDGVSLLRRLRAAQPGLAVIMLSALDAVADRVEGLDAGADDYLAKPFDAAELMARVRAALRRPGAAEQPAIACGRLRFCPTHREVWVDDTPLPLRRRELAILESLMLRQGRVVTRDALAEAVFGFDDAVGPNALDAHVSRLRARLAQAGAAVAIHPVRGVGYMLAAA